MINFFRYLTIMQTIQNNKANIVPNSGLKRLVKERRHTVRARGCNGFHLLHGYFDFLPTEVSEQQ